jgi:CheY-like chemotaxis protein/signal transduction histidine kinase
MKLVIVDDIAVNRKLLRVTLEAEGHTTLEAADGIEALEILAREKVDAVLSDILMPRMDGYRLCHEIRTNDRLRDLPIIIYTSTYTSLSDQKLALNLGADKYLTKPAPVETILAALHEAIATEHTAPRLEAWQEVEVLKEYSGQLVTKLEEKNIELEQRLRLAALSVDVGSALMQGNTLPEILERCSEAFVPHLDAACACIWTHNEREKVLELQASAGMHTPIDGPHGRVPVGQFNIGLIAEERKPHLTNSLIDDPRFPEQEWIRREGLVACAGCPLIIGNRVIGVMAMFARHSLSQATLDRMASTADAVARGIERKWAEDELCARTRELAEANEQLTILDRSKDEFLTLISHEFRTPLSGLLGVGELILDGMSSTKELQGTFERSRRRILSILDDALLLTQIDVKGEQLRSAPVSLSVALSRAIESATQFTESRHVTITLPSANLGLVAGDEDLLVRALHALLETAVKFSEEGETVRLAHEVVSDSVKVTIESYGRTIPSPALPKFFDIFSVGEIGETITPGGDLGLGPALAHRILSLFGASVSVANRDDPSGIRLTISLKDAAPKRGE